MPSLYHLESSHGHRPTASLLTPSSACPAQQFVKQDDQSRADFYARDIAGIRREGVASLKVFLGMCREDGVEPRRQFSGKFNVRIPPELHAAVAVAAAADGKSLNQWVADELRASVAGSG